MWVLREDPELSVSKPKKDRPVTEDELLKLVPIGPGEVRSKSLIKRKLTMSKDPRAKAALKAMREGKTHHA